MKPQPHQIPAFVRCVALFPLFTPALPVCGEVDRAKSDLVYVVQSESETHVKHTLVVMRSPKEALVVATSAEKKRPADPGEPASGIGRSPHEGKLTVFDLVQDDDSIRLLHAEFRGKVVYQNVSRSGEWEPKDATTLIDWGPLGIDRLVDARFSRDAGQLLIEIECNGLPQKVFESRGRRNWESNMDGAW